MGSVDWLNAILHQMWPNIDKTVASIVSETIEPALKQAVPAALRNICFQHFSLGIEPLRVDAIHAIQTSKNSVSLMADIVFDGQPSIQLSTLGMKVGVHHLILKGRLSLAFKPLVSTIPVLAAVHISFANVPYLQFDMTGIAGRADAPQIHNALQQVILDAISDQLVLPNVLVIKLGDDTMPEVGDLFAASYTAPRLLRVTVAKATNLKNLDASGAKRFLIADKSDPYAVLRLGAQKVQTRVIYDNLNPVWNESFELLVHSDAQSMAINLWDEDPLDADDDLGSAAVTVADLLQQGELQVDIGSGSTVYLQSQLFSLQADSNLLTTNSARGALGVLSILVDQAFDLPVAGHRSALVKAHLAKANGSTKAANLFTQVSHIGSDQRVIVEEVPQPNPEWEQAIELLVYDLTATLIVELVADNITIGTISIALADISQAPDLTLRQRWELQGCGGGIFMTLHLYGLQQLDPSIISPGPKAFGGTEQWVTLLVEATWPFVDKAVEKMMRESILPLVAAQLPFAVKCNQFSLGKQPPLVQNFRVTNPKEDGALLLLDISYEGHCEIQFSSLGATFGIKKAAVAGTLCVLMQPFVPQIPVIGAFQIFFINQPSIDLHFTGMAGVLDMPRISEVFRKTIKLQLQQQLVLPAHLTVRLAADTPLQNLFWQWHYFPKGVMRVTVVEARGLKNTDDPSGIFSYFRKDVSDPYCILTLGDHEYRTRTIDNNLNPVWGQTYDFIVLAEGQILTVELYDEDTMAADDLLGVVEVTSKDLCAAQDMWLPITRGTGELHLTAVWLPLTGESEVFASLPQGSIEPTALVTVLVDQAMKLPTVDLQGAHVEVTVGGTTRSTRTLPLVKTVMRAGMEVVEADPNPDWEEAFVFLIPDVTRCVARCVIMADALVVGEFSYDIAGILADGELELNARVVRQVKTLEGSDGASLTVSFALSALCGI